MTGYSPQLLLMETMSSADTGITICRKELQGNWAVACDDQ